MPRVQEHEAEKKEATPAQLAARAEGAKRLRAAAARRKVASARSTRQFVETEEEKVGQDRPRNMKTRGPAREALEPQFIEPVEGPLNKEKIKVLAFMEEMVTVMVHDTTNPLDAPIPEIINGGDRNRQYFIRGQEQTVRRKYIEVLARMKKTSYTQEKYKDGNGDDAYRQIPHTTLMYPFVVTKDSPEGHAWLKRVLAEA